MKKSKLIKAVAAITMSAVSTVACFSTSACTKTHKHTWGEYVTDDYGHYRVCSDCNLKETYAEHDYDSNYKCTVCDYQHTHSFNTSGDCSCGLHEHQYETEYSYDNDYHWHEATCGHDEAVVKEPHTYVNHVCSTCNLQESTIANYEFNPAVIGATSSLASNWTDGMWTVSSGTEIRGRNISSVTDVDTNEVVATPGTDGEGAITHSVKLGADSNSLSFTASGAGTLKIWVSNGSTGKEKGAIKINGTSYEYGGSGGYQITYNVPKAGTYTITRNGSVNGTSDIYYASFTVVVPVTAVESIEIANAGTTEYYVGQEFSSADLAVNAVYETTGVKAPVTGFTVDSSDFRSEEGEYTIRVSYTSAADGNKVVSTSYKVRVYSYQSIALTDRYTVKESTNSSAGNGVYATHVLRTFYLLGEELDSDGLVVTLTGKCGSATDKFVLSSADYSLSGYDKTKSGKQTVTVTAGTINSTFEVYVADFSADSFTGDSVSVRVNNTYGESLIGSLNNGEYRFDSITRAIEFLESLQAAGKLPAKSTINLEAGKYEEKLEIKIPNLTIVGAGADSTTIEYNELWGVEEASGFVHTTDSTATLNVREAAVNFTIKGVTISNYYNSSDAFAGSISPKGERALAMLIQADKVIVQDCVLLGWQDTLELFTGRQYFINSVIKGTTDFIFGTNNTTYFYQCEIQTIINKNTNGGGYITAMKGQNKGSSDKITYGVIFDDCDFTFENGVPAGTAAIGRTWGADAAVMIMNSRLGAHISTTYNKRYVSMNNNDPAKAQFMEYNNTGAGALSSASNNYWTVPSAETAANYNNLSVIFGTTNGLVKYADVWDINKTIRSLRRQQYRCG